jgi:hypothetical protein
MIVTNMAKVKDIEYNKRRSVHCSLKTFDFLAKDSSFIEVTEWTNGEGFDISIDDKQISLTHGELEAINFLTKSIEIYNEAN